MIDSVTTIWWDITTWPQWQAYLLRGMIMAVQLVAAAIVLGRTGRTPYWSLVTLIPVYYLVVIGVWALAYCHWPRLDGRTTSA